MLTIKDCIEKLGLFSDRVGIRILPNERVKYMQGKDMYFAKANYKDCQVDCAYAKKMMRLFLLSHM